MYSLMNSDSISKTKYRQSLILPLDWNWPDAVPGRGSAIFIHQWRRPGYPTAGCLAFARRDLIFIARHAAPGTEVIVPQP